VATGRRNRAGAPKHRRYHQPAINEVDAAFNDLVRELGRKQGWLLVEMETMPNHAHLLIEKAPWEDLAQIVKAVKAFTARQLFARFDWLRRELASVHFWTPGYHYERHTDASLATVRAYIRNQRRAGGLAD
jgi:putative transposase